MSKIIIFENIYYFNSFFIQSVNESDILLQKFIRNKTNPILIDDSVLPTLLAMFQSSSVYIRLNYIRLY